MHDNSAADFALPDHRLISLSGRDAVAFAQAQFMNDVHALTSGHWQWNGWLTPKGRVIALFALLRIDNETVWLLLPDADPVALVAALQHFVFRSKVVLAVREDLRVSGAFTGADSGGAQLGVDASGVVELDMGGTVGPRRLRIGIDAGASDDALLSRWIAFDLQHGLPRLPVSQVEQWTPQQLSLERLRGFSVKKGCYPGQEIVARTHFLGKAKRGLALLESATPMAIGADVRGETAPLGTVIANAADNGQWLGLTVLPLDRTAQAMSVDGAPVSEQSLQDGLAR